MDGSILKIALLVAGAYYVGFPILIWLTHRQNARPDARLVDMQGEGVRPDAAKFLSSVLDSLEALGFRLEALLDVPHQTPNTTMLVMLTINKKSTDHSLAVAMFAFNGEQTQIAKFFVQFVSRYPDRLFIQTSNLDISSAFPQDPNSVISKLPSVNDLARLYENPQMIVAEHRPGARKILRLFEEFNGDAVAYLRHDIREDLERAQSCGYMWLTADGEKFRPTVRGAVMMTYKQLFPFKMFGAMARKRRERQIMADARARGIAV